MWVLWVMRILLYEIEKLEREFQVSRIMTSRVVGDMVFVGPLHGMRWDPMIEEMCASCLPICPLACSLPCLFAVLDQKGLQHA